MVVPFFGKFLGTVVKNKRQKKLRLVFIYFFVFRQKVPIWVLKMNFTKEMKYLKSELSVM